MLLLWYPRKGPLKWLGNSRLNQSRSELMWQQWQRCLLSDSQSWLPKTSCGGMDAAELDRVAAYWNGGWRGWVFCTWLNVEQTSRGETSLTTTEFNWICGCAWREWRPPAFLDHNNDWTHSPASMGELIFLIDWLAFVHLVFLKHLLCCF